MKHSVLISVLSRLAVVASARSLRIANRNLEVAPAFELSASHSVQFERCVNLEARLGKRNDVVSSESYVTFRACENADNSTCQEFFTHMNVYAKSVLPYLPESRAHLCDECRSECRGDSDDGVKCHLCEVLHCDDKHPNKGLEIGSIWALNVAGCARVKGNKPGSESIYAGLICNKENDGIGIGIFGDRECSVRYRKQFLSNLSTQIGNDSGAVELIFAEPMNCSKEAVMPKHHRFYKHDNSTDNVPNKYCQNLFHGDESKVLPMSECREQQVQGISDLARACIKSKHQKAIKDSTSYFGSVSPVLSAVLCVALIGGLFAFREWRKSSGDKVQTVLVYEMVGSESSEYEHLPKDDTTYED